MASGGQVFDKLYLLSTHEDSSVTSQVRNLLHLIPTDPAILDALDSISAKKVTEIPSPTTPKSSPRSSPKNLLLLLLPKNDVNRLKEVLKNLFDVSYQISHFKLLYILEALSGKLMPVAQDTNTVQSAQMFSNDFLSAGAAAGNLLFMNCSLPIKEGTHSCMGRSRQSSTGSNASSGSDTSDNLILQGGVCAQQNFVKEKKMCFFQLKLWNS
ncbi:ubiquitinyl hydrolase 1 [Caerostris extrusa]|uniref:Ubiquitinyl hydrolase 1 n=1 Tax=Caerostris extrusa TaxID=172846 RepID=A0AAV4XQI1_CAEEX|nr:ubiquitinyl hydrolase 1 [Caerostris extrusa]